MSSDDMLSRIVTLAHVYYTPFLIGMGCIGNALTVLVLMTSKMKRQSTCQYLSVLAGSDSVFLLLQVAPWLDNMGYTDVFVRRGFCEISVYLSYVACCFSSWLVAAFTVERFVAVLHPLKRSALCTVTRARIVILSLFAAALLTNSPVLVFASPTSGHCAIDQRYMSDAAAFNMCDTVISFTLPLLVIVILNSRIGMCVARVARERRQLQRTTDLSPSARAMPVAIMQHKITTMLLFVSTVFVLFNLPAYVMRLLAYAYDLNSSHDSGFWSTVQQAAFLVFNTNFGINFFLYCMSGQNFRRALVERIPWLRRRQKLRRREQARQAVTERYLRNRSAPTAPEGNEETIEISSGYSARALLRLGTLHDTQQRPASSCPRKQSNAGRVKMRWKFDNTRQKALRDPNEPSTSAEATAGETSEAPCHEQRF